MIKKVLSLTSFGAGYVLGARAGRERYEQLRKIALRIKDDPQLQHSVEEVTEFVHPEPAQEPPLAPGQDAGLGR